MPQKIEWHVQDADPQRDGAHAQCCPLQPDHPLSLAHECPVEQPDHEADARKGREVWRRDFVKDVTEMPGHVQGGADLRQRHANQPEDVVSAWHWLPLYSTIHFEILQALYLVSPSRFSLYELAIGACADRQSARPGITSQQFSRCAFFGTYWLPYLLLASSHDGVSLFVKATQTTWYRISPGLGSVVCRLSHAGSLRKPEMRKLVRELCQVGGQSDGVTDDPYDKLEAHRVRSSIFVLPVTHCDNTHNLSPGGTITCRWVP